MKNSPLVTVLMPVYNAELHLREAIQSVLNQTYINFEFLIINDGSTDNSKAIIQSFVDERIKYVENEENLKLITTLNKGISLSSGVYIARMDADDVANEYRLEKQIDFLEKNTEYGIVGSWCNVIGSSKKIQYHTSHNDILFAISKYCPFIHPSVVIRKSILLELDVVFDSDYVHAEDYELWTRLIFKTKVVNLPEYLTNYREHEGQISSIHNQFQMEIASKIQKIYMDRFFQFYGIDLTLLVDNYKLEITAFQKLQNLNCLFEINNRKKVFQEGLFERRLKKEFKNTLLNQTQIKISEYRKVLKMKLYRSSFFTLKQKIVFLLKVF